jgi:hypothetical protein
MSNIIIPGFTAEGNTDVRFLASIIQRTFEQIAFECEGEIEVYEVTCLPTGKSGFAEEMLKVAKMAFDRGIMSLCIHTDADDDSDEQAFTSRIEPAFHAITTVEDAEICKNLVALVPVQMTEAWLIADTDLLREELGTTKSDQELGLNRSPETIAKPKELIEEAIRIAFDALPRRRRRPSLKDLYLPLGQKINIEKLSQLYSFQKFQEGVREAYRKLNYLD